jgi:hypothetical protein
MINKSQHPVSWSSLLYELDDAREHLGNLIRDLENRDDYSEEEFRIDLGHVFAHLNRAWNTRDMSSEPSHEQQSALSRFPTDLEPQG